MLAVVSFREAFFEGFRDAVPVLIGIVPYAMIVGVAAVAVGIVAVDAIGMSLVVFAGASQLAAMDLIARSTPIVVIVVTTFMINLRFAMYSAALAPRLKDVPAPWRALIGFVLTDQAFALMTVRFREQPDTPSHGYALGVTLPFYVVWAAFTAVGAVLGAAVPASWQLDFALPLTFLALLFPNVRDRPAWVAALVGGALALVLRGLPFNLGLVIASLGGVSAGAWIDVLRERSQS